MRRLFTLIVDHPVWTLALVLLVSVGLLVAILWIRVDTDFTHYMNQRDPAVVASNRAEKRFGSSTTLMIAVENQNGIFNQGTLSKIQTMEERFAELAGVSDVKGPLNTQVITGTQTALVIGPAAPGKRVPETAEAMAAYKERALESDTLADLILSSDGTAAAIFVTLEKDADRIAVTRQIASMVEELNSPPDTITISGIAYMNVTLQDSMAKDLLTLLPLVIAMVIVILFASFRKLRGVGIPFLVVTLAIVWTMGLMALAKVPVTVISFVLPVLLMAIGIAYSIHILNHYNETIAAGRAKRDALLETMVKIHPAVVMAGLTTVGGFAALLTAFMPALAQFGLFAGIGVASAMVLSLAVVPAMLSLQGVPKIWKEKKRAPLLGRGLSALEERITRHPVGVLLIAGLILLGLAAGMPLLRTDSRITAFLGENHPAVVGMTVMEEHFSGSEQVIIEIDTGMRDGLKEPAVLEEMLALETFLKGNGVKKTTSITDVVRQMNRKFHDDDPAYDTIPEDRKLISQLLLLFTFQGGDLGSIALGDFSAGEIVGFHPQKTSAELTRFVDAVEAYLETHFADSVKAQMVGQTKIVERMSTQIIRSQLVSLGISIVAAALIVCLLMGSLTAGLIAVIPLALTVVVNLGLMAYTGIMLNIATAMISSVTIGIGIDYAIHFISRYRSEMRQAGSGADAALTTARTAGQAIVFNALAVLAGFAVLLFSSFIALRSFGGLIALSMVVSAVSALTVIPAVLLIARPAFAERAAWSWWKDRKPAKKSLWKHRPAPPAQNR